MRGQTFRPVSAGVALVTLLLLASSPSHADPTKDQCVDADAKAQDLRREHQLSLARAQLQLCSQPACPALVRSDCTTRMDDLERVQPTLSFEVKSPAGLDVSVVDVALDGKLLTRALDGTAYPVDPGAHTAVFTAAGYAPVTRSLVVNEGVKGRVERVLLAATGQAGSAPAPAPTEHAASGGDEHGMGSRRVIGLVGGGLGVVGLAVGGVFGAMALSEKSNVTSLCAVSCSATAHAQATSDHASGVTDGAASTVGFVAGGALLVAGAVLFFTGGAASGAPASTALHVAPGVGPGGGGVVLGGAF